MAIQRKKFGVNEFAPFQAVEILDWGYLYWPDAGQTLSPIGTAFTAFGTAAVTSTAKLYPTGNSFSGFGSTVVYLKTRLVYPVGLDAFKGFGFGAGGSGFVDFAIRHRYPAGIYATLFGAAEVSGGLRYVTVPHFTPTVFGTAFVTYKDRSIEPSYFVGTSFGTAQVGYHRTISASGFDASNFGAVEVFDNRKVAKPSGFIGAQFGDAFIAPRVRNVYPTGFWSRTPGQLPDERWGRPEIYNSRQYIEQYYEVTPDDGGVFGRWHEIANRNRTIQAYGWNSQKFALTNQIKLKGIALAPLGFEALAFGVAMVAYRIRSITTIGKDTSLFTPWAQIRNTAQVLLLSGFDALRFGTAAVVNTRRYYTYMGAGGQGAFGVPFVAYRVRTIVPYYPYEGGEVKEPLVQLGTRYVRPTSIGPDEVGAATVEEHFTIIAPRWLHVDRVGEPSLRNVTPQLYTLGYPQTEWGTASIYNQFERYAIQGFSATVFGATVVERREKYISPNGINAIRWGQNTRIRNNTPDPPGQQTLLPNGWDGLRIPSTTNGADTGVFVRSNVIFPESLLPMTRYGVATVVRMGIGPAGDIYLLNQFGNVSVNSPQYVVQMGNNDQGSFGKPRMSPHTVWAGPAPTQAILNHGGIVFHPVDYRPELTSVRPKFGGAVVTNKNRHVEHYHRDGITAPDFTVGENFGDATISNRRRWIYPSGKSHFKYGIPVLNNGGAVEAEGQDSLVMGLPTVEHYIDPLLPRRIATEAFTSFEYGQPVVSNFIRHLIPTGLDATMIGTARVHPPEPIVPTGFQADVYGNTFISNYVRTVEPTGIEPPQIDYVGGYFVDRMRVSERHTLLPTTLGDLLRMGSPKVSNRVRTIRPTDEIVGTVSAPTVTARSYVSVAAFGIDAGAFGDVQRWEAGKIKPYGDDMLRPGYPRMARTVSPGSILGAIGSPRVGQPIRPAGMFTQVIGDMTITHGDNLDFVCGQLPRAIPVPGNHFGVFGIPVVSR